MVRDMYLVNVPVNVKSTLIIKKLFTYEMYG